MSLRSVLASIAAATAILLPVSTMSAPAGAASAPLPPPPGVDPAVWNWDAATPIDCWFPQAAGWVPADPSTISDPDARARYAGWLAHDARQRARDGRWEVLVQTDKGSAPFCVQVLPELWVADEDVGAVQAYLLGVAAGR